MTASKRAAKELEALQENLPSYLRDLRSENSNVLIWNAVLLPDREPYNLRAFKFRITFPRDYPLSPPHLKFITKMYHPNVTEDGEVCLPRINGKWMISTKVYEVLEDLKLLVNTPNPDLPLRVKLADLYIQNPEQFMKNAKKFTLQFGEDRTTGQ
ncbi:ubiquitin/ISG15-conjugating enzyme E2 L6 [Sarcophilus harrisii]|uniref:E2 ubiquitin-conjugating enzyme n=1 Tax=Sarcophilus harrisii TaxID=9305 RepID=A0A7N4V240_SARHA|nr:ubiquitin/ISG15-conjugating enzyme E2 L6 [Sarcophilus harrisii]